MTNFPPLSPSGALGAYTAEELLQEMLNRREFFGLFVGTFVSGESGERVLVGASPISPGQFGSYYHTGEPEETRPGFLVTQATGIEGTTKRLGLNIAGPTQDAAFADVAAVLLESETEDATSTAQVTIYAGTADHQIKLEGDGDLILEVPAATDAVRVIANDVEVASFTGTTVSLIAGTDHQILLDASDNLVLEVPAGSDKVSVFVANVERASISDAITFTAKNGSALTLIAGTDHQIALEADDDIALETPAGGEIQLFTDNSMRFKVDDDATSAVYVWADGSLKQVTAGAADSGGSGFKLLRVAN